MIQTLKTELETAHKIMDRLDGGARAGSSGRLRSLPERLEMYLHQTGQPAPGFKQPNDTNVALFGPVPK